MSADAFSRITAPAGLAPHTTTAAEVIQTEPGVWRLQVPASSAYRLAQLDDYQGRRRSDLPWRTPLKLSLRARAGAPNIPGTWGFGLWNDPFGLGMNLKERLVRLPALPNTAWFFHASPENYLSLREDLPAQGWLAGTFHAPRLPAGLLALGAPGLALLAVRPLARWMRRAARLVVRQDAAALSVDVTEWHTYGLIWQADRVVFSVDGQVALETRVTPQGPLGVVIWIDNQYMRFTPDGRLGFGVADAQQADWIEISDLSIHA